MKNRSGEWLFVSPTGQAIAGPDTPPAGSTVLVAPGAELDDEKVALYKVEKLMKAKAESKAVHPSDPGVEDKAVHHPAKPRRK